MTAAQATILDTIGNTSLLPLRHVVPANGARILLKLESENPTGSMIDSEGVTVPLTAATLRLRKPKR